jgi:GDP-L-fucose synthase
LADACLFLLLHYDTAVPINVGTGEDIRIRDLAALIAKVVGYDGGIVFDQTKPDGTPRKLLDVTRLASLGWKAQTALVAGVESTYRWYVSELEVGAGTS